MEEITEKISLFHNLFLACAVLCAVCLIVAIVVFFLLDIRDVIGYLTGRQAKKQIQALKESNEASGRLMSREKTNMQHVAQGMKEDMGVKGVVMPGARKVDNVIENAPQPKPEAQPDADATGVLQNTGSQDTTVLSQTAAEQQTSHIIMDDSTAMLDESDIKMGTFAIEKEIIMIHTEEVI